MIARLGALLQRQAERVVPDPFLLALGLTVVVLAFATILQMGAGVGPVEAIGGLGVAWLGGLGNPAGLAFALQMSLILVTGHALALSPPVQRLVQWIATLPRSGAAAVTVVALVACLAGAVHWGLGAIVGALLAREIGRAFLLQGRGVHYPLLGAAAYCGMAVWHGGLSGSAPLVVAESTHFAHERIGTLPLSETIFSGFNIGVMLGLIVLLPLLCRAMVPEASAWRPPPRRLLEDDGEAEEGVDAAEDVDAADGAQTGDASGAAAAAGGAEAGSGAGRAGGRAEAIPQPGQGGVVDRLQRSVWTGRIAGALMLLALLTALRAGEVGFDLNAVNFLFLSVGILLQGRLRAYVDAVAEGARGAGAIILQFPFYFGILAVMQAGGMVDWISALLVSISTPVTFPLTAFVSAGIVNFFVPSGGGQWAVQADILLGAGADLGVAPSLTVLAFAYGDAWTNMLQPFWALPLLGIMGLRARDIIGYTALLFVGMGVFISAALIAVSVFGGS